MSNLPSLEVAGTEDGPASDPFNPAIRPELFQGTILRRVVAYLIDLAIIAVVMGLAAITFAVLGVLSFGLLSPLLSFLLLIIPLAYHTALIGGPASATVGMRLFGIEVRRMDGGRPSYPLAAVQTIVFYTTVGLTSWLVLLVALFNARGRTLHDYLCGTLALNLARRARVPVR